MDKFTCEICGNEWILERQARPTAKVCKTCLIYQTRTAAMNGQYATLQDRIPLIRQCTNTEIYYRMNRIGGYTEEDYQDLMRWKGFTNDFQTCSI